MYGPGYLAHTLETLVWQSFRQPIEYPPGNYRFDIREELEELREHVKRGANGSIVSPDIVGTTSTEGLTQTTSRRHHKRRSVPLREDQTSTPDRLGQ